MKSSQDWFEEGKSSFTNNPQHALQCYNNAIDIDQNCSDAHLWKGVLIYNQGKKQEAIACYDKAISINPNDALYLCNRGKTYKDLGTNDLALNDFRAASKLLNQGKKEYMSYDNLVSKKEVIESYFIAASLCKENAHYEYALKFYAELKELDPKNKGYSEQYLQIFNIIHYGDDSSDEEAETKTYKTLPDSVFYNQDTSLKVPPCDIKWSLIMQELGIRLLISNSVRKLYFTTKSKIGQFDTLPNIIDINKVFENAVLRLAQNGNEIINDHKFKESLNSMLESNMDSVLALKLGNIKVLGDLFNLIQMKLISSSVKSMYERHVDEIVNQLKREVGEIEVNTSCNISASKPVRQKINSFFVNKSSKTHKAVLAIIEDRVVDRWHTITTSELKKLAVDKLVLIKAAEKITFEDFIFEVQVGIKSIQNQMIRPILPDSTSMSPQDFEDSSIYSGCEMIFSHIRLSHASIKRYIKNKKSDDSFDGANFSRGWQFDDKKTLSVIEQQELSGSNKAITALIQYPYASSYPKLLDKLKQFQDKTKLSDKDIINKGVIYILQKGNLDPSLKISSDFERFLMVFTYHLFGTEVQRHPAAAIHNVIALDLISKHDYSIKEVIGYLPMTIESAVKVARTLQIMLQGKLSVQYFYDKASGDNMADITGQEFQDFVIRENAFISKLKEVYSLQEPIFDSIVNKIDDLCFEYYKIKLAGENINEAAE